MTVFSTRGPNMRWVAISRGARNRLNVHYGYGLFMTRQEAIRHAQIISPLRVHDARKVGLSLEKKRGD